MRTFYLIKSLNDTETKEVELLLNDGKRQNLFSIFRYLKKHDHQENPPAIQDILKTVFKQPFTKSNELQLRNKLSRLNDILYEFITIAEFKNSTNKHESIFNQWLAQAFHSRQLPMFQTDVEGFIQTALNDFMLDEAIAMLRLRSIVGDSDYKKRIAYIEQWQLQDKRRLLLHLAASENMRAVSLEREDSLKHPKESLLKHYKHPNYHPDLSELQNEWYFAIYETTRKALLTKSIREREKLMKKVRKLSSTLKTGHPLFRGTHANVLMNISYLLIKQNKFEEADNYLSEYIKQQQTDEIEIKPVAWVNYMVNLSCLGKLEEVIKVYEENLLQLIASPFAYTAQLLYCSACVFTNKTDLALKKMPDIAPLEGYQKIAVRNLYAAAFIKRKDYKLAQTEIYNLKRAIAGFEKTDAIQKMNNITLLIETYLAGLTANRQKQKALFARAKRRAKALFKIFESDPALNVLLKWLMEETS